MEKTKYVAPEGAVIELTTEGRLCLPVSGGNEAFMLDVYDEGTFWLD